MNILAANLKHFYQRRGVWIWYVLLLCQTPVILSSLYSKTDRYLGYLIVSLLTGVLSGALQKNVLSKPFSFCLPGHRHIARPLVFWVGGTVNLILGCVFLGYPGLAFPYVMPVILAGGLVGMIVFFYGVYIGFIKIPAPSAGILGLLIPCTIWIKWDIVLQNIIIDQPILIISASALVCVWVWRLLGRDILARKHCGKLVMGIIDDWNIEKLRKYEQAQVDQNPSESRAKFFQRLHEFFLGRMKGHDFLSSGRYIWGYLYMVFGQCFGTWRTGHIVVFLALMTLFLLPFGYMGEGDTRLINIIFAAPAFAALSLNLLPHRNVLLPAGRTERYYSSLALAAVVTVTAVLLTLVLTGLTDLMARVLPEVQFGRQVFSYRGMDIDRLYVYLLLMPIAFSTGAVFSQNTWGKIVPVFVLLCVTLAYEMKCKQILTETFGLAVVAGLIVLCWAGFLIVLHHICMKRSLVR